jgi:hypothetical protein
LAWYDEQDQIWKGEVADGFRRNYSGYITLRYEDKI